MAPCILSKPWKYLRMQCRKQRVKSVAILDDAYKSFANNAQGGTVVYGGEVREMLLM